MQSNQSAKDERPLALVTGASTGIGRAFVALLAGEGYDVIAVARSAEPMEVEARALAEAFGADVKPFPVDLTTANSCDGVQRFVEQDGRPLSLLVNNAGFGVLGGFAEGARAEQISMIELNNRVAVGLTHRFLPDLIAARGGIINVASLSAYMPMPYLAVYSATKAFLLVFSRMLAVELAGKGVRVTAVCPGYTRTAFHARSGVDKVNVPGFIPKQSPEAVAAAGYRAWKRGRRTMVTGWANKLTALVARFIQPLFNLLGQEAHRRIDQADDEPGRLSPSDN